MQLSTRPRKADQIAVAVEEAVAEGAAAGDTVATEVVAAR